jgi:hypothetical protein
MCNEMKGVISYLSPTSLGGGGSLFFLFIYWTEAEPSPVLLGLLIGLIYQPCIIGYDCGGISEMNDWQEIPKYLKKT